MIKGNEVVISVGSGEKTCPVKILRRYLTEIERYPVQSDHFVFRALPKCKSGHKLVAINRPVNYSTIREYFKVNFKDIVPDISLFSTHSLRSGGASAGQHRCTGSLFPKAWEMEVCFCEVWIC